MLRDDWRVTREDETRKETQQTTARRNRREIEIISCLRVVLTATESTVPVRSARSCKVLYRQMEAHTPRKVKPTHKRDYDRWLEIHKLVMKRKITIRSKTHAAITGGWVMLGFTIIKPEAASWLAPSLGTRIGARCLREVGVND